MQQVDLIVTARWILPIAPENISLENHALVVHQDKIVDLLPAAKAKQLYQATSILDYPHHILMPGLVNAHAHTPMNLFRGLADDLPLMEWLEKHIWPAEQDLICPESVAIGSKLAIAEMLRGGTTCFNDHYFFPAVTAHAAIETGIRATIGLVVMSVPTQWAQSEDEYFSKAEHTLATTKKHDLISWSMAPHAPYTVSDATFKKVKQFSDAHQLPIHIHMHETAFETQQSLEQHGIRPIQRLHNLGLMGERMINVHMVDVTASEMEIVAKSGASIVHCPESNLKLASGFSPIADFLKLGINVAIGTDGAASNNDLDMFGELQTAAMTAKAVAKDPTVLPANEAIKMATLNGAKALGLGDKIGSLEKNKFADFIAVDTRSYLAQPIYNPFSHLAYTVNRLQVSDAWVAGKQLLKNGELTKLNTNELVTQAKEWAKKATPYMSKAVQQEVV